MESKIHLTDIDSTFKYSRINPETIIEIHKEQEQRLEAFAAMIKYIPFSALVIGHCGTIFAANKAIKEQLSCGEDELFGFNFFQLTDYIDFYNVSKHNTHKINVLCYWNKTIIKNIKITKHSLGNSKISMYEFDFSESKIFNSPENQLYTIPENCIEQINSQYNNKNLFDNKDTGFALHKMIFDAGGKACDYVFLDVNPAFEALTGLKRESIINKSIKEVIPEIENYWIDNYGRVATTGEPMHSVQYTKPVDKYFEVLAFSPAKGMFASMLTDVSAIQYTENQLIENERKFKEQNIKLQQLILELRTANEKLAQKNKEIIETGQQLQENENRLNLVLNLSKQGFWEWEIQRNKHFCSPFIMNLLGIEAQDLVNFDFHKLVEDKVEYYDFDRLRTGVRELIGGEIQLFSHEFRFKTTENKLRWLLTYTFITERQPSGLATKMIGLAIDITERRQAIEQFDLFFTLSFDLLSILNFDGYLCQTNIAWYKTLGWDDETLLNRPWLDFVHHDDREKAYQFIDSIKHGELIHDLHIRLLCENGSYKWFSWKSFPLFDEKLIYSIGRDTTELIETNKKLENSRAFLKRSQEIAHMGGWEINSGCNKFTFDSQTASLLDIQPDTELSFRNIINKFCDSSAKKFKSLVYVALKNNTGFDEEFEIKPKNERRKWIRIIAEPNFLKNQLISFSGIIQDITARRQTALELSKSHALLEAVIEQSSIGIVVADASNFKTLFVNNEAARLLGKAKCEIMRLSCADSNWNNWTLIEPDGTNIAPNRFPLVEAILNKNVINNKQCKIRRRDGSESWVQLFSAPVYDNQNEITAGFSLYTDITELKNTEYQLIIAKNKAEESDNLKSAFLANMSHEIRTPLNGIVGFANLLQDDYLDTKSKRDYVNVINESSQRLSQLVEDIVDLSKIHVHQLELYPKEVELIRFMLNICNHFQAEIQNKDNKVKLVFDYYMPQNEIYITIDIIRLKQIMHHLIQNAIKFSNKGVININHKVVDNQSIIFIIKDEGIGIPVEFQKEIFKPFYQINGSLSRELGGTGLGLAICKGLTEIMGGTINLKSEIGIGSEFLVQIPIENIYIKKVVVKEKHNKNRNWHEKQILIVEDDHISYKFLQEVLLPTGAIIIHKKNGLEAVEFIYQEEPAIDLILMDMQLPILSGYEAAYYIREKLPIIPIIAQTALTSAEDQSKAIASGCNKIICKPIIFETLFDVIDEFL